jgi:hypothetical protein
VAEFPLPKKTKDLTGKKIGRLTVTGWSFCKNGQRYWICDCSCGKATCILHSNLKSKKPTKSCGCIQKEAASKQGKIQGKANTTHGDTDTVEYVAWRRMLDRCNNSKCPAFANYGGRGIKVCERWMGTEGYVNFLSDMQRRPQDKYSLERVDVNGNYEPTNCIWADWKTQQRNRRNNRRFTAFNVTKTCAEWAEIVHAPLTLIVSRLNLNWEPNDIVTVPPQRRCDRPIYAFVPYSPPVLNHNDSTK